ncbi:MAG TPA: MBL fold metallo-hydrolase [Candidatus Paceibacterota bacterium]
MVIQYYGMGFVKVSLGNEVIAFAPTSKDADIKGPSFGADICLVPLRDPNYDGVDSVTYGNRAPIVVDGPGEYEIAGTFIKGVPTPGTEGKINTAYSVLFDDIRLVHLGVATNIPAEAKEVLSDADILFCHKENLATSLDAKIIIPMYEVKSKDAPKSVDKLVVKRKDLEGKEGEIIPIWSA